MEWGGDTVGNPKLELAKDLIKHAVLEQLHFNRFEAERLLLGQAPRQLKIDLEFGGTGRITSPATFDALVEFRVMATGEDGAGVAKVNCAMAVKYRVPTGVALKEDAVAAFAEVNGVFNAWPYFREYVQSAAQRLGVGINVTVPLLRFGEMMALRKDDEPAKGAKPGKTKRLA